MKVESKDTKQSFKIPGELLLVRKFDNLYPSISIMGRECAACDDFLSSDSFSRTQWAKGYGYSRCRDCVNGVIVYQCHQCARSFNSSNQLNMHMQVHRQKNVSCPVCGDTRFGSSANAVQHVESGYCTGCTGQDNARQQIYEFSSGKGAMRNYMTETARLTYGDHGASYDAVPDYPYCCRPCNKQFRNMSQLLQHQDNKHSRNNMLTY